MVAGKGTPRKEMPRHYVFKSAVFTNESGRTVALDRVDAEFSGTSRRPLRLRMSGRGRSRTAGDAGDSRPELPAVATIEMSQREAFAFSEWLDGVATDPKGMK